MNILALDLGTVTGWAVLRRGGIFSGSQSFKPGRYDGGGMRYLRFVDWLNEMGQSGIDYVCYEEVRNHAGVTASHVYGGFLSHLQSWCERWEKPKPIPYEGVPVGTIKSSWTGKGNSGKDVMMRVARERGHKPVDDNEADAIALLYWAMHERGVQIVERKIDEATSRARIGPASDVKPRRRVQVGPVCVARRRIKG